MNPSRHPSPPDESELDAAVADYLERVDRGDTVDPQAWLARYPALAEPLHEFIATSQMVERFVAPRGAETD